MQRLRHHLRTRAIAERARTVTCIKRLFHGGGKKPVILRLLLGRMRRRIESQPRLALSCPVPQQFCWKSIRQPKGNKVDSALLLPMRQPIFPHINSLQRIKEMWLPHSTSEPRSQLHLQPRSGDFPVAGPFPIRRRVLRRSSTASRPPTFTAFHPCA